MIIYYSEVKRFLEEEAERTLNTEQLNMKLEGVAAVFRESLGEMEDLDREIEDIARQILPPNWTPQDDALRRERGAGIKTLQTMFYGILLCNWKY